MTGLLVRELRLSLGGAAVLGGIDAGFARGRVAAVLGPNGAGKSSLLACLASLRAPDSGTITLDGQALAAIDPRDRARRIGLLPQTADVHWDVDVATLVALGRYPRRGRWGESEQDRAAVVRAMAATDVTRFADRRVETLSGGERGRVLLARVLAGEPEWLLADEPLASLDPAHQLDVLDRLRAVAGEGAGVVVVLHDLNQAARVADDVVLMRGGRIVAAGAPEAVLTPALIAQTYGVEAHVGHTPQGQRYVIPVRRT
ncbi:ABC transporter ATP-binding protein [Sphingomonas sp. S1-29]|uniref:ABC transporter ATP-binding protein n=1 Tax=Sphingomonas sp. S1-29 TaxID=2991074 RepID=UPI00224068A5|nr:ABC transporter ATP-binding protein [Sphingomonas sp. S1-29]UZK69329.1 ABC transporter ATP-binding protein [Sphingomonas sp. S1-29]